MKRAERTVALTLGLAGVLASSALHAQNAKDQADALFATKFEVDESDPASKVPSVAERDGAPLDFAYFVMNLGEKAEEAEKKGDRAAQIRYLRGVAAALPDRSAGFSKLCSAYEADRQLAAAEQSCAAAIGLPGASFDDFARYVRVVFGQQQDLSPAQVANLESVQAHLQREAPQSSVLLDVTCQLAIRGKDAARFASCASGLDRLPASDIKRLTYHFAWAIGQKDYAGAKSVIAGAKAASASSELVDQMTRARSAALPWWRRLFESYPRAQTLGAIGLAMAGVCFVYLRQRRMLGASP